jgi:septum formation protein
MLNNAGLVVTTHPARVDESSIKESLRAEGASAADVAEVLAELKAKQVSRRFPGALVIGADQMLDCNGRWFDKAKSSAQAAEVLTALRGKTHSLISCAVVVRDGQRLWHHSDTAHLTMRPFSDAFLSQYLQTLGDRACETVGAYHLEGLGAQMFSGIKGDFFTILGLPLVPLMGFLRAHQVLVE